LNNKIFDEGNRLPSPGPPDSYQFSGNSQKTIPISNEGRSRNSPKFWKNLRLLLPIIRFILYVEAGKYCKLIIMGIVIHFFAKFLLFQISITLNFSEIMSWVS